MMKSHKRLWIGLVVMALISPIGIIVPRALKSGDAWGEWSADALKKMLGYLPEGLGKYAELWKAPVADYSFGGPDAAMGTQAAFYIISGLLGLLLASLAVYLVSRLVVKHEK